MMKRIITIGLLISLPWLARGQTNLTVGEINPRIVCLHDSTQHYALFLPADYTDTVKWPVIFFFEPAARALLPLQKYMSLAEKHGYVMLCSYNSRNGPNDPIFEAANAMYSDAFERLSLDENRVCLSGFSGGARVSCLIALSNTNVASVVGCGAGFPYSIMPEEPVTFDYCGIIGKQDMNFQEMIVLDSTAEFQSKKNLLLTFPEGHRWPDPDTYAHAFYWLETNAMKDGKKDKDEALLSEINAVYADKIGSYSMPSRALDLARNLKNIILLLDGLTDISSYREQYEMVLVSDNYQNALLEAYRIRTLEAALQKKYFAEFEEISLVTLKPDHPVKPAGWWRKEFKMIDELNDPDLRARLREFVINGSWEQNFNSLRMKRYNAALQYLEVYEAGLPNDPSPAYCKAIVRASSGDAPEMYRLLQKAVDHGLDDPGQITGEEAFRPYLAEKRMQKILDAMKNGDHTKNQGP